MPRGLITPPHGSTERGAADTPLPAAVPANLGSLDGVLVGTQPWPAPPAGAEPDPVTFTATAAYPYVDRARAAAALRNQLRQLAAGSDGEPDWSTFLIDGPTEDIG